MLSGYDVLDGLNTNFYSNGIKPIVEQGTDVYQLDNAIPTTPNDGRESGFWSFLDDIGSTIAAGAGIAAQGWVGQQLAEHGYYDPDVVNQTTSRGDTNDYPGNKTNEDKSFIESYKQELIFGAVVIASVVGLVYVSRS